jgi:hypothetical protein
MWVWEEGVALSCRDGFHPETIVGDELRCQPHETVARVERLEQSGMAGERRVVGLRGFE